VTLLAVDLGGTHATVANERERRTVVWPRRRDAAAEVAALTTAVRDLATGTHAVGVAAAPALDGAGTVTRWPTRPHWAGVPLLPLLRAAAGTDAVVAGDDGALGALAEARDRPLLYVGIGTGVGAGVLRPGDPARAVAFGHVRAPGCRRRCVCGRTGCVQAVAAGPALLRTASRRAGRPVGPRTLRGGLDAATPWARDTVAAAATVLAAAIAAALAASGTEVAVLGGGVAAALPELVALVALVADTVPVEAARHDGGSSLAGAFAVAANVAAGRAAFEAAPC
jgi:kanosamine 6-kinase